MKPELSREVGPTRDVDGVPTRCNRCPEGGARLLEDLQPPTLSWERHSTGKSQNP